MWYCAIGPRYCSDGVLNEICLYYKFNVYHSLAFIDKSKKLGLLRYYFEKANNRYLY